MQEKSSTDAKLPVFSERLKLARSRRRLKQKELADLIGVTPPAVTHLESGRNTPTIGTVVLLAKTLNVSADWLLGLDT